MATTRDLVATDEDLAYLRTVGTGVVHDALVRLKLKGSAHGLRPLQSFGKEHVAGPAKTVRFLPVRGNDKPVTTLYEVMADAGNGVVIVVDGQGHPGYFFGGHMAHLASRAGVEAVVIDGGFRDTQEVLQHGVRLFSSVGASVAPASGSAMLLSDVDIPIACNSVQVRPGDIAVGDDDGVVFIPSDAFDQVLANVRDIDGLEQQMERTIGDDAPFESLRELLALKRSRKV